MSTGDTSLRILVFGSSGPHQFSLTESVLQREILYGADPNTVTTQKTSEQVLERNVTLVNTPNLRNHGLSPNMLKKEFRKSICFSCPGPHAVLFTLHPLDMPSDAYEVFRPVVEYFGESILDHTVVVLYHQGELSDDEIETKMEEAKELFQKCGQKYFTFNRERNEGEGGVTAQLFDRINKMVSERMIFSNPEFKDAENRIKKEEKFIAKEREKEVRKRLEALKKQHSGEDLDREVRLYEEKACMENRERAEVLIADRLGFTLRLVDYAAAVGKGAFAGAVLGAAMGNEGVAVGAAIGAALGGLLGGAAGAAWNFAETTLLHRDFT